jgi:hypothetical protein
MPRRQRFKPSRKPKPAIEPSEQDVIGQSSRPTEEEREIGVGERDARDETHPEAEDRVGG